MSWAFAAHGVVRKDVEDRLRQHRDQAREAEGLDEWPSEVERQQEAAINLAKQAVKELGGAGAVNVSVAGHAARHPGDPASLYVSVAEVA